MKKYALITTCYCENCSIPSNEELTEKFNYDGDISDLFVNFSNKFSPFNINNIPNVGNTRRKDLVYGKIFMLKDFIKNNILGKYEYLCHIDYSDTKFVRSYLEMMENFESSNKDIIISTEKKCWPDIDTVSSWLISPIKESEFFYVNSGAIIAKVEFFYNILLQLINLCIESNIDFWDDQGVWQYYHLAIEPLNSDKKCEYFFSTALLDDSYYSIENGKVITKYGTMPYLIHDNSSFSLNLISKF